jgi:hypothetical protein
MIDDHKGRFLSVPSAALKLLALLSPLLLPALAGCTTAEGTNAFATPATFEREVMTSTLQGLDIVPQEVKKPDDRSRTPLVLPKQTAVLPPPQKDVQVASLPANSDNPQISTAGLTKADLDHLRNARVVDLNSLAGRPLTDVERRQLTARMQAANMQVTASSDRPLYLPPPSYFSDFKGADKICLAKDGTLVSLTDAKCPDQIKKAMRREVQMGNGVDAGINQDLYSAANGKDANGQ